MFIVRATCSPGCTEEATVALQMTRQLAYSSPLKSSLVTTATIQPEDRDEDE
jgi:hypothetical protein